MKQYLKFLMLLILSLALIAGINSCGKESSGGIEPTPVNPTPNNGGGGGKPDPEKPDDKPIGDGKVNVFEQVVAVQESEITSVKSDTAAHHYTITYNNAAPEIKPGNVVVVQDGDETRIILVTEANVSGNTAELDGPLGDLSYVFYDTKFTITTNRDLKGTADVPVYYSDKSLQKKSEADQEAENNLSEMKFSYKNFKEWSIGGDELMESLFPKPIKWSQPSLFSDEELGLSKSGVTNDISGKLRLEFEAELDFDFTANFEFSEPVESTWGKLKFLCAGKFRISAEVGGSLSLSPKAELSIKDKLTFSKKRMKLFDCPDVMFTVPVGFIPLNVHFSTPIYADFDLSVAGEMTLQIPLELKGTLNWKCSYDAAGETGWNIEKPNLDWSFEFKPSFYAKAKVGLSLSVYPEFNTFLYTEKLGAPAVAPKAVLSAEYALGAGTGVNFDLKDFESKPYAGVGSDFSASIGFEAALGFIVPFTTNYKSIKDFTLKGKEKFYQSPTALKIKSINGLNIENIYNSKGGLLDYGIIKNQPLSINYTAMSEFDLIVHRDWEAFMPHIYEYGQLPDICKFNYGFGDQTLEWTPKSDLDYLDIVVANSSGKDKGKVRIGRKPKLEFKFIDEHDNQLYAPFKKNDPLHKVVKMVVTSDLPVDFTITLGGYDYAEYNATSVTLPLRTDKAREVEAVIKAVASNGFNADDITFNYRIENNFGQLDPGESNEIPFFKPNDVIGPVEDPDPIEITIDEHSATVYQSAPFTVTGSASDPCTVIVEVDGSTHQTIKDATAFTINLPTDVIGNHSVKVYVSGQNKGAQTFSYKVEKKPDTPATGNTTVPSVSGTDIDQKNTGSGYAPNVNGQNVNSEYNSGGNAPSVKGQNLDQYYNGGGSTPDIKGTNL